MSARDQSVTPRSLAAILNPDVKRTPDSVATQEDPRASAKEAPRWKSLRELVFTIGGKLELLLFRAGSEGFAVPLESIQEAIDDVHTFILPDMPAHVSGMITLSGRSIPIYQSRIFLGVESKAGKPAVLIVKGEVENAALVVDSLVGSLNAELSDVRRVPALEDTDGAFVGVFFHEGELFTLLDTASFLRQRGAVRMASGEHQVTEKPR